MKHILVIADKPGKEQHAVKKALSLAKMTVADVHVVTFCFDYLVDAQYKQQHNNSLIDLKKLIMEDTKQKWDEYIKSLSFDVRVTHETVWEKHIHTWILSHCQSSHYDLIIKTGHRSENLFYTPTDWQLFRESTVPIYSISNTELKVKKVVLVALDLMAKDKEKQQLNEKLLEAAFQLSVQLGAELHCCFAIRIPTLIKDMDMIDVTAKVHQLEKKVREQSKAWAELYDIDSKHIHIREGKPWHVINNFARKLKAECVVVGSVGRKGISAKIIGNTAEKVIQSAKTDLLVI